MTLGGQRLNLERLGNGFVRILLPWRVRADVDERYRRRAELVRQTNPRAFEREYELSFSVLGGAGAVYGREFDMSRHVRRLAYNANLPLYRSWDFGYMRPALLWAQVDGDRLLVLREWQEREVSLDYQVQRMKELTMELAGKSAQWKAAGQPGLRAPFSRWKDWDVAKADYCDPFGGSQRSSHAREGRSAISRLRRDHGLRVERRVYPVVAGVDRVRQWFDRGSEGQEEPGILIDPSCERLIEGCAGGWLWDPKTDKPARDMTYEDLQDCLRYLVVNLFPPVRRRCEVS